MSKASVILQNSRKKRLYIRKALWITPFFKRENNASENRGDEIGWSFGVLKCDLCKEEISKPEINLLVLDGKILATLCDRCRERYRDVFK